MKVRIYYIVHLFSKLNMIVLALKDAEKIILLALALAHKSMILKLGSY